MRRRDLEKIHDKICHPEVLKDLKINKIKPGHPEDAQRLEKTK